MFRKFLPYVMTGLLAMGGFFTFINVADANAQLEPSDFDDKLMPSEVKNVLELMNSGNLYGNSEDGYSDIPIGNDNLIGPTHVDAGHKYNTKMFGYSLKGASVIDITASSPGFWKSLYQNKYDGWGYTADTGTTKPNLIKATLSVSASGVIPNISFNGSSWGLLTTTRVVAEDSSNGVTRKYAQAHVNDLRVQNITNLLVKFEVKSELHYATVGSQTAFTSVQWW